MKKSLQKAFYKALFTLLIFFSVHIPNAVAYTDYIVQVPEWQYLEDDAVKLLKSLGYTDPYLTSRNEIRAYVFTQLFDLMRNQTDNPARTALIAKIREFRAQVYFNALKSHDWYANNGCFTDPDAVGCLIGDFFGGAPNYAEFTEMGLMETLGELSTREDAVQIKLEMTRAIEWLAAHQSLAIDQADIYGTLPDEALQEFMQFQHQLIAGIANMATMQLFGDLAAMAVQSAITASLPTVTSTAEALATSVTVVAGVIVAAYTIYHITDRVVLYNTIKDRADNPDSEPLALNKLTSTSAGMAELFEIVTAQLMGPVSIVEDKCTLQSSNAYICKKYSFGDDPDFISERYTVEKINQNTGGTYIASIDIPARNNLVEFWIGDEGSTLNELTATNEMTPGNSFGDYGSVSSDWYGMVPWLTYKRFADNWPDPPTGGDTETGAYSYRDFSARTQFRSYVTDKNTLATLEVGRPYHPELGDPSWKYNNALNYTNWNNEWWTAWRVGDQFLHKRRALKLDGQVAITEYNGGGRCFENPPAAGVFSSGWAPQGPRCLLGSGTDFNQLQAGDEIVVGGIRRKVSQVGDCSTWTVLTIFGVFEPCGEVGISDTKAVIVDKPFPEDMYSYDGFGNPRADGGWGYDYAKWYSDSSSTTQNCVPHTTAEVEGFLASGPGTTQNCFMSPLIQYKAINYNREQVNFSAIMATPFVAVDDTGYLVSQFEGQQLSNPFLAEYIVYEDEVLNVTRPEYGLLANDRVPTLDNISGEQPWSSQVSVTISILTPANELNGELIINNDGTFTYTPDPAVNDWASRDWLQTFEYQICNNFRVDQCDAATVTIIIDNRVAEVTDANIQAIGPDTVTGNYTLSFLDYTYTDVEGDLEDLNRTQLCWTRGTAYQSYCWQANQAPVELTLTPGEFIGSDWGLSVWPVSQTGRWLEGQVVVFNFGDDRNYSHIENMQMWCTNYNLEMSAYQINYHGGVRVGDNNPWLECTVEVTPYVDTTVYFDTSNPYNGNGYDRYYVDSYYSSWSFDGYANNWNNYNERHEKTFTNQFCQLEEDVENGVGRCSVYWRSEKLEYIPQLNPDSSVYTQDLLTQMSVSLLDRNGAVVTGDPSWLPRDYTRYMSGLMLKRYRVQPNYAAVNNGVIPDPVITLAIPTNVSSEIPRSDLQIVWNTSDSITRYNDLYNVILQQPSSGSVVENTLGNYVYTPETATIGQQDSFTYQICQLGYVGLISADIIDSQFRPVCTVPIEVKLDFVDTTPPTITAMPERPVDSMGWYNSPVSVLFECGDRESEVTFCGPDQLITADGENIEVIGTARDAFNNTASVSEFISIDQLPPTIRLINTASANDGWYNSDVTIEFDCFDELSGVYDCPASQVLGQEGLNTVHSIVVTDTAGNSSNGYMYTDVAGASVPLTSYSINIDKTAPVISLSVEQGANLNEWLVHYSCEDVGALSGVAQGACPVPTPVVFSWDTNPQGSVVIPPVCDNALNCSQTLTAYLPSITGFVDLIPPQIQIVNSMITVEASAINSPVDLGMISANDLVDTDVLITNDAPVAFPLGQTIVTYTATDDAGNIGTAMQTVTVVDTTPPVFTVLPEDISQIAGGGTNLGQVIATDIFPVTITNDAPAILPVGETLVTWAATDANGNSSTATQSVTLTYQFLGYLEPLKDGAIYKANRTLPVKFELAYADGSLADDALATLSVYQLSNDEVSGDPIEISSSSAADSGNTFRTSGSTYIHNLDTSNIATGEYRLVINLDDGSSYSIDIGFK